MVETPLTLYIDLPQGARLDLETAAHATLAWSRFIKTVGYHVDPFTNWEVELESSLPGSLRLSSIIKLPENAETRGMVKGAILAAILFILEQVGSWGVGEVMDYITGPDAPPEVSRLSKEDIRSIAEEIADLLRNQAGREEAQQVYQALEKDTDVSGVGVTSQKNKRPEIVVPRASFPSRQGDQARPEPQKRTVVERMDVVVVKAVLAASPTRRWGFQTRAGSFGAPIRDAQFLADLTEGRLNVPLRQGIVMDVDLEVTEEFQGGVWRPQERAVLVVHRIRSPAVQIDLFRQLEPDATDEGNQGGDDDGDDGVE